MMVRVTPAVAAQATVRYYEHINAEKGDAIDSD